MKIHAAPACALIFVAVAASGCASQGTASHGQPLVPAPAYDQLEKMDKRDSRMLPYRASRGNPYNTGQKLCSITFRMETTRQPNGREKINCTLTINGRTEYMRGDECLATRDSIMRPAKPC